MRRKPWIQCVPSFVGFAACIVIAVADVSAGGPKANYFPNVTLRNQDGKEVRFYDDLVKGKIIVINLMYTHCDGT
jgi:protein SCO1/2